MEVEFSYNLWYGNVYTLSLDIIGVVNGRNAPLVIIVLNMANVMKHGQFKRLYSPIERDETISAWEVERRLILSVRVGDQGHS